MCTDLPAVFTRIDVATERRRIFCSFVADLNQPPNPARLPRPTHLQDGEAGSPLLELHFGVFSTTTPATTPATTTDTTNQGDTPCAL